MATDGIIVPTIRAMRRMFGTIATDIFLILFVIISTAIASYAAHQNAIKEINLFDYNRKYDYCASLEKNMSKMHLAAQQKLTIDAYEFQVLRTGGGISQENGDLEKVLDEISKFIPIYEDEKSDVNVQILQEYTVSAIKHCANGLASHRAFFNLKSLLNI